MSNGQGEVQDLFKAETLTGDIRDVLLTHVRAMDRGWQGLSEDEQRDKVYAMTEAAGSLVRKAIATIAHRGFPHITVTVGKFTVDKGVKIEVGAVQTVDNIEKLAVHGKGTAVMVLCEASTFFGEQEPAAIDKDEPGLPLGEDDERDEAA